MISGIGTDIIEIDRVQRAIERWGDDFIKHVFCEEEIEYAKQNKNPFLHYAARFAAKEAVFKAIGNQPALSWKDIKIVNDSYGRPVCSVKKLSPQKKVFVSLSHCKEYAVANAIVTS